MFIYCRKSSESEDRQVLSVGSQVAEMEKLAEQLGVKITAVFTESKSAKAPGVRPAFLNMVERLEACEAKGIMCWNLDRLARNPIDGGRIIWAMKEHGIQVITPHATYTQDSDNVVTMYLEFGMAQKFIDELGRNVKRGLRTKANTGWFPGKAPLGYSTMQAD